MCWASCVLQAFTKRCPHCGVEDSGVILRAHVFHGRHNVPRNVSERTNLADLCFRNGLGTRLRQNTLPTALRETTVPEKRRFPQAHKTSALHQCVCHRSPRPPVDPSTAATSWVPQARWAEVALGARPAVVVLYRASASTRVRNLRPQFLRG